VKKPKTPKTPAASGFGDLAGSDMTFTHAAGLIAAASPAVLDLAQHLSDELAQIGNQELSPAEEDRLMDLLGPTPIVREDEAWDYPGAVSSTRRLQVTRTGPNSVTAYLREGPSDPGTSIADAAEAIVAKLRAEHPGQQVAVIEEVMHPEVAGIPVAHNRIDIGENGSATRTPLKRVADWKGLAGPGCDLMIEIGPAIVLSAIASAAQPATARSDTAEP
jgi:hypothetical protein